MAWFSWLKSRHHGSSPYRGSGGLQQGTGNHKPNSISVAIQALIQSNEAASYHQSIHEKRKFLWDKWTTAGVWLYTLLTLVIVLLSGFGVKYARDAAKQARRQADEAGLQTKAAQTQVIIARAGARPYLFIQVDKEQIFQGGMAEKPSGTGVYGFKANYRVSNYGATPAIIKEVDSEITLDFQRTNQYQPERHVSDVILGQGQSTDLKFVGKPQAPDDGMRLYSGQAKLYINIRVSYIDAIGNQYYAHVCYRQPSPTRIDSDTSFKSATGPDCDNDRN